MSCHQHQSSALSYVKAPSVRVQVSSAVGSRFSIKSLIVTCTMPPIGTSFLSTSYRGNAAVIVVDQGDRLAAADRDLNVVAVGKLVRLDDAARPICTADIPGRSFRISLATVASSLAVKPSLAAYDSVGNIRIPLSSVCLCHLTVSSLSDIGCEMDRQCQPDPGRRLRSRLSVVRQTPRGRFGRDAERPCLRDCRRQFARYCDGHPTCKHYRH